MPILGPTGTFLISDLVNEVILRCENRTTDTARAAIWLRDALLEISSNPDFRDDFDQLEILGPTYNLTIGIQEYAFSNFVTLLDYNDATLDILIWIDPPTNVSRRKLRQTHYQESDKFSQVSNSPPTTWYRFADNVGFTPVPDKAYQVQARYLRQHPIAVPDPTGTQILLPADWNEILVWSAVQRGFMELLEYEKAQAVHVLLYGDPKNPLRPGLINGRKKRRERENWRSEQALRPVIRSYSHYGRS